MSKQATTGLQLPHINNQNSPFIFHKPFMCYLSICFLLFILFEQIILVQQRRLKIPFLADNFLIPSLSPGFTEK